MAFDFLKAAEACERAANAGTLQEEMAQVHAVLQYREEIQIALTNQAMARTNSPLPGTTRLPLRCDGDDFGRVEARIPKALFFGLRKQKNFGDDGFTSDAGMKDFLKAYPQCAVKTVSGKTTVGYRGGVQTPRRRVNFGRGTLQPVA